MKTQGAHAHEDRLLDFAYGELPPTEARLVEQHVQGCSRCSEALEGLRGVRTTMSRLPLESAPDAGLESLLAYAQQAARRSAAGPEPAPRWWRRLLAPALGMAALSVFGIVVVQVNREVDLSPAFSKKEAAQAQSPRQGEPTVADSTATPAAPLPAAAPVRAAPTPTKSPPPKKVRDFQRADFSNGGAGSAGGFPDKKVAYDSDEESNSLEGLATQESKPKRDVAGGRTRPSVSTAPRAEPARGELLAEAEMAAEPAPESPSADESQAVRHAPPEPKQTIRGSASRPASVANKDSAEDDAYGQQAPGRAQVASASPPPPPPAQYQAPAAAAGSVAQAEGLESRKAEVAQKPVERSATKLSPSLAELMRQADVANRSGDWEQEVAFLRAAMAAGAQGTQRLEVLSRLCDAEFALGRRQNAIEVCKRVMAEAPGSSAARMAQRRLEREFQSPVDEADSEPKAVSPTKK
ncbi:zf-HC2 domain-containing protein [Archangium sp.]|uniref:zf-HC2 domain-containing protein n=1 Tax=Archangium sp. TaxID=1872627 RepID=UPI002D745066|nr:zf-HC2 domain-containing protein [Archangium sp.]HYO59723.1 zf-HC2 domain-containing protein [Archangium sp.]